MSPYLSYYTILPQIHPPSFSSPTPTTPTGIDIDIGAAPLHSRRRGEDEGDLKPPRKEGMDGWMNGFCSTV
jgi:hypothetical protein